MFLFRYGNPEKNPGFFVGMVTLLRVRYVFFFFFFSVCLDGGGVGEAGNSPQSQFGVGDMWSVCC